MLTDQGAVSRRQLVVLDGDVVFDVDEPMDFGLSEKNLEGVGKDFVQIRDRILNFFRREFVLAKKKNLKGGGLGTKLAQ